MREDRLGEEQSEERFPEDNRPDQPEEQGQTDLDRRFAALTEGQWKALQVIGGISLGIAGGLSLFYLGGTETFGSVGLLLAIGIMVLLPNILQRSLSRSLHLCRIASAVTFGLVLILYFLLNRPQ